MECFLAPGRTRTLFKCVSFGAILLWILFGSYVRQEPPTHGLRHEARPGGSASTWGVLRRHLLSSEEELDGTVYVCEDMFYTNYSVRVDPQKDQVSYPAHGYQRQSQRGYRTYCDCVLCCKEGVTVLLKSPC